jgi:D-alanine-D-alanine ligase
MKVAVVYNRESERVINLFGLPNREKYGKQSIKRITDSLKKAGHQVVAFEGDKDLVDRLEDFMPRVVKGERPGMVFNLSYGIQGQARYTHVPSILEMVGIPYVGSGPQAHSLSLDKVVAKMIFRQHGVPTPDFDILHGPGFNAPDLQYPLIVKPRNEAVSFGLKIVNDEQELRDAANVIFDTYKQPALVERYIEGREINVGLLGNNPPDAFAPAEILFGEGGPQIYTFEDKTRQSGREIGVECPASLDAEKSEEAQEIARNAFFALGCYDCARVDMRLDEDGNLYVLEINSLPSLGEHGSYVHGARDYGLDFTALVNKLVEVATIRYFGFAGHSVSRPSGDHRSDIFGFLVENRDGLEKKTREWVELSSRTYDPVGLGSARKKMQSTMSDIGMEPVTELIDDRVAWTWQSKAGFDDGTLLVGHLDVPLGPETPFQPFRRDPETLYGEGIGCSRSPLVMTEYALRALRRVRRLKKIPVGVLLYSDEGRDCRYSADIIRAAASRAKQVLVLRPCMTDDNLVTQRRGMRTYWLNVDGTPLKYSQAKKKKEVLRWVMARLEAISQLSSAENRVSVFTMDIKAHHAPLRLPHQVWVSLLVTYPDVKLAETVETRIHEILGHETFRWRLEKVADRPPLKERKKNTSLVKTIIGIAEEIGYPIKTHSSTHPSAAGLVPASARVVCGMAPGTFNLYTPTESIARNSLTQRTLLLAHFLDSSDKL